MAEQVITPPTRSSGFRALMRHRNYAILWTSQGISLLGDRFHWVAISLWVYAQTGSALSVSYAVIALMVGPAAVGLFAGVLVERWKRKGTMILADPAGPAPVAAIPLLMSRDIRLVYLDLFLISCATAFFRPAMLATLPSTVAKTDLLPANSFFATIDTGTEIIGPVLAGFIVQLKGYSAAMYIDAVSYVVSAMLLGFLSVRQRVSGPLGSRSPNFMKDFIAGLQYVRGDRLQLGLLSLIFLGWWVSGLNSLQTPFAKGVIGLSDQEFGWFNGVWGIGFVFASLLLGWYGASSPKGQLILGSFIGWALATGVLGASANKGMLFVAVFWVGFMNIALFIGLATMVMEITPQEMLGRVLAIRQIALAMVRVLAMLGFGLLGDWLSIRFSILAMACLSVFGVLVGMLLFPEVAGYRGTANGQSIQMFSRVRGRFPDMPRPTLATLLLDSRDLAYEGQSQRTQNAVALLISGAAWVGFLIRNPRAALFVPATIAAAVAFKLATSAVKGRQGSKNVLQRPATVEKESDEGRRRPLVAGPTSE